MKVDTFWISFWLFCIYVVLTVMTLGVWEIAGKM